MIQSLIGELAVDRDWRFSELEFCRKIPNYYVNPLFKSNINKFWRMCIPIIYAHWEGFVVHAYQQLVNYINRQNLKYSQVKPCIILLSNKQRFKYLQSNLSKTQKERFLDEFLKEELIGINMPLNVVSASSNLNYKMFLSILSDFEIPPTPIHESNKMIIEKLVTYRNKIAHGEGSVIVYEADVNVMIETVMEMIDTTINDINQYVINNNYKIKE